jgi:DNA-binding CsgD family transcriptional regulator
VTNHSHAIANSPMPNHSKATRESDFMAREGSTSDLGHGTVYVHDYANRETKPVARWVRPDGSESYLTLRQLRVLAMRVLYGRKEGAARLGIAESTVRNHITHVLRATGAETVAEAVRALGWLRIPEEYQITGAGSEPDEAFSTGRTMRPAPVKVRRAT